MKGRRSGERSERGGGFRGRRGGTTGSAWPILPSRGTEGGEERKGRDIGEEGGLATLTSRQLRLHQPISWLMLSSGRVIGPELPTGIRIHSAWSPAPCPACPSAGHEKSQLFKVFGYQFLIDREALEQIV